jgi:hypothetical protein
MASSTMFPFSSNISLKIHSGFPLCSWLFRLEIPVLLFVLEKSTPFLDLARYCVVSAANCDCD